MPKKFNRRALLLQQGKTGEDDLVDRLIASPDDPIYAEALDIYKSKLRKQYLEAALLTEADIGDIAEVLDIEVEIIQLYAALYYDVKSYSKLEKLEMLEMTTPEEVLLKMWAISQGLDFIKWRLGKKIKMSPVEGLEDLFQTSMWKAKESMFNANNSDASRESAKWVKLSMDLARLIKAWTIDGNAAKADLAIALQQVMPEFTTLEDLMNGNNS